MLFRAPTLPTSEMRNSRGRASGCSSLSRTEGSLYISALLTIGMNISEAMHVFHAFKKKGALGFKCTGRDSTYISMKYLMLHCQDGTIVYSSASSFPSAGTTRCFRLCEEVKMAVIC